ncbi:MAG: hypothetical protein AB1407_06980, partial [Spirochaetota bacterium]
YKVVIHLYDKEEATVRLSIAGQEVKAEKAEGDDQPKRQRVKKVRVEAAEPTTVEEQAAAFEAAINAGRLG